MLDSFSFTALLGTSCGPFSLIETDLNIISFWGGEALLVFFKKICGH